VCGYFWSFVVFLLHTHTHTKSFLSAIALVDLSRGDSSIHSFSQEKKEGPFRFLPFVFVSVLFFAHLFYSIKKTHTYKHMDMFILSASVLTSFLLSPSLSLSLSLSYTPQKKKKEKWREKQQHQQEKLA
jgi:hypothetical protein